MNHLVKFFIAVTVCFFSTFQLCAKEFELTEQKDGLTITYDGKLLTRYLKKSGSKPVLWPIIGPDNMRVTRNYPLADPAEGERNDHIHHRSFWFTHGAVNDSDFWAEGKPNCGEIVHQKFEVVEGGNTAKIVSTNLWIDKYKKPICRDRRTFVFGIDQKHHFIDFEITLDAIDKPVKFGDTKEGSFGIRVAGTMKVDAGKGGTLVNNHGQKNKEAWGKQAAWVDYYGPVADKTIGIAILNHPSSFRYPTYWHVRTYGLFAANVFGKHDFEKNKTADGSYMLKPGSPITFKHRVLIHAGTTEEAKIQSAFERYADDSRES